MTNTNTHIKNFFIVESPNKIKKIRYILNEINYSQFDIFATMGHFRDLTIDPKHQLGIQFDLNQNTLEGIFELNKKNFVVSKLNNIKKIYQNKKNYKCVFYLATDPDREGEAIAWHIYDYLKSNSKNNNFTFYRVKYQSITKDEIKNAIDNATNINMNLVHAQLTRRYIDRIVGWLVSPLVQKNCNVMSAGRVQSIVVKLILERHIDIEYFLPDEFYYIHGTFKINNEIFKYQLINPNTNLLKFDSNEIKNNYCIILNQYNYNNTYFKYHYNFDIKEDNIYPNKPFITSSIQKECFYNTQFKWNVKKTMFILQNLFEKGLITYHRTDSYYINDKELNIIKNYICKNYGNEYSFRNSQSNTKNKSQEAHECIRPTNIYLDIENINDLELDHKLLYDLILKRTIMSQMINGVDIIKNEYILAIASQDFLEFNSENYNDSKNYEYKFIRTTRYIKSLGFRILLNEKQEYKQIIYDEKQQIIKDNYDIILDKLEYENKKTSPPPLFNQASLISKMEDELIGRPSTYAYILEKIINMNCGLKLHNNYDINQLEKCENYIQYLNEKYEKLFMDIDYTRNMEKDLDLIANGELCNWQEYVINFYKKIVSIV
jgi:DNA topoisomerase-1